MFGYVKLLSQQLLIQCFYLFYLNQPYIDSLQRVYIMQIYIYFRPFVRENHIEPIDHSQYATRYVCDPSDRITVLGSKIVERFTLARCKMK